jgi:RNA polymerase sigma factor (sigma-70 family)
MAASADNFTDDTIISVLSTTGRDHDAVIRYLYRIHYRLLSQYVICNNGSADDAQDIFQEVIISFVQLVQAGKFRGESSIRTFLFSLNRNLWLNELRRRGRSMSREERYHEMMPQDTGDVQRGLEYREAYTELMRVLDELGEVCKKILVQFYYEKRSMKEIVLTLNYENEQVVRNKKHKCLKKMESLVQGSSILRQQLKTFLHD